VAVLLAAEMGLILATGYGERMAPLAHAADYSNTRELGRVIYTVYAYPFEIAAAILLLAIVAAIALTLRRRPETKFQNAARQVRVRREDRVRLVKMPAEKKS
jgi:NADH-quinone oxidoreductase subunit J